MKPATLKKTVDSLSLPEVSDQHQTATFLSEPKDPPTACPGINAIFQLHSIVSYDQAKDRKRWLKLAENHFDYQLHTCVKAVRQSSLVNKINYWVCYSYPGPVWERTSTYHRLLQDNASAEEIENHKINHRHGRLVWHAALVKFHDRKINSIN
jgi:hypothetical protein